MSPTVLLFDIDGTLISTGGAGRRAMAGAFEAVCGPGGAGALQGFSFAGMTDRAIVRAGLVAGGFTDDAGDVEARIDVVLEAYLVRIAVEVASIEGYRVLPGVTQVLAWLATLERVAVGLGTGNVRRGAMAKLARGALDASFAFGGFGCDAEDRAALLRVGAGRGAEQLGVPVEGCRVVIIGDTPKDVAAAAAIGAACIGVGTGGFSPDELRGLGAFAAFATLEADGVRDALLG
ncbi:MAG: HAD family hydrolase [Labilithrix sp.]|nr:HAD family hydrolase [Labilithrix sp.]